LADWRFGADIEQWRRVRPFNRSGLLPLARRATQGHRPLDVLLAGAVFGEPVAETVITACDTLPKTYMAGAERRSANPLAVREPRML
jgi:hypothetical protein